MSADADEDDLRSWFERPPEQRALDLLQHVLMNLRDLPEWACDDSPLAENLMTFPVFVACRESFFVNARLSAEFFWKMPQRDITARDLVPDWTPPKELATRMERIWWLASKHMVHLSRDRLPKDYEQWQPEDCSYRALMRITRDAFAAFRLFIDAHERDRGAHVDQLRDIERGTRPWTKRELAAVRRGKPKPPPVVIEWWR